MANLVQKALLGTVLGAATLTAIAPTAEAQRYGYRDRHYRGHDDTGTAIVAGIAGLAIGAALAGGDRYDRYDRYDRRYDYDRRYYRQRGYYPTDGYYYRDYERRGWQGCSVRRTWDPYSGRNVRVRYCR